MLLQKVINILTTEIRWGRIALLALGASAVALLVSGSTFNLLSLTIFSIIGIFVERVAPKHPFVNAFFYGLLGVVFYVTLVLLQALGLGQTTLAAEDVLWLLLQAIIVVVPQSLIGAWIGSSIRKFSRVAAESRKSGDATGEKAAPAEHQAESPPQKKKASSPPSTRQRKKKG